MKRTSLSGFPEWLPRERHIERYFLDAIARVFESRGFCNIETRAVERLSDLVGAGDTGKEVYAVRRAQAEGAERDELGLRFDLTVPLARYVVENRAQLTFPFKRYQIQKVWRGERAQEGRYREFYQADADIVGLGSLSLEADAELIATLADAFRALPLPKVSLHVNSRRLMESVWRHLGIDDVVSALRLVDKIDKIGEAQLGLELASTLGLSREQVAKCIAVSRISSAGPGFVTELEALGIPASVIDAGAGELLALLERVAPETDADVRVDLRIARGLDYYTGFVVEGFLHDHIELGAVCSGGRYENLATDLGARDALPGAGVSIGVSRLLGRFVNQGALSASRASPSAVLVAVFDEPSRQRARDVARTLRRRGIAAEVFLETAKVGRQIKYADAIGIPYVWFVGRPGEPDEIRDLRIASQTTADATTWTPDDASLRPHVRAQGHRWPG